MIETIKSPKIIVASNAGFCFGVRRAIKLAENIAKKNNNVFTLGPLIHNPQEVKRLSEKGIYSISNINKIKNIENAFLILRTHGVTSDLKDRLKCLDINIIDATCPFVKKAQNIAKYLGKNGYQVIIVGEKKHPEVVALVSYCKDKYYIIENKEDLKKLVLDKKVAIISQTTQPLSYFTNITEEIKKRKPDLKIYNTICKATMERQNEALKIAKKVDIMIVIGGKNSANTSRLSQICSKVSKTYSIETHDDIKSSWFKNKKSIGITAGASTPDWIIYEVIDKIKRLNSPNYR